MNKSELNQWLTLLANVGVIAGIVFLGIEISQNTDQLESDARATRVSEVIDLMMWRAENSEISDECTEISTLGLELTRNSSLKAIAAATSLFEIQMWQYMETGLPDYLVQRYRSYGANNPCYVIIWDEFKVNYDQEFVSFMDAKVYSKG